MKRLFAVLTILVVISLMLPACGGGTAPSPTSVAAPQAAFDWQKYKGTTIRVMLNQHPWTTAIQPSVPDFEKLTGIKVNLETYPEDQFRQKSLVELTSGAGTLDVFMSQPPQEGLKYVRAGWYEDLTNYVKNPALTDAKYNFGDFLPGTITFETVEGKLVGVPIQLEVEMLFYRKDLFEAAGIKEAPKTLADLEAAAKKLHDPSKGVFGFASRGKKAAAVTMFSNYLYNHGGDWLDKDRKPTINSPEAVKALTFYGNLLKNYGPPGSVNNHWNEVVALFQQGKVAMFTDASVFYANVEDKAASTVAGKVGYAPFPAGDKNYYWLSGWGLSMAKSSKVKEASWYFIQWATSPEMAMKTQAVGKVAGARKSVWNSAEGKAAFPSDWTAAYVLSSEKATKPDRPPVVAVAEIRDAIGAAIVTAIEGGNVKAAADKAAADVKDIMDKTEK